MIDDFLGERRRALEESFFAQRNRQLLEELRAKQETLVKRDDLAGASGIHDEGVLDRLIELGLCQETVAAFALVPLIEVAWADHKMDDRERQAILSASTSKGIDEGTVAHRLVENWLSEKPDARLHATWKDFAGELAKIMPRESWQTLRDDLMQRARQVAESAGGILGLGSRVSAKEQAVLDEIEQALSSR